MTESSMTLAECLRKINADLDGETPARLLRGACGRGPRIGPAEELQG
jgi:hypothetical protein